MMSPAPGPFELPAPPSPSCRVVEGLRHTPIPRRLNLSLTEFQAQYSQTSQPVILAGAMNDWPASRRWSTDYISAACGSRSLQQECQDTRHRYLFRTQLKLFNQSLNGKAWAGLQEEEPASASVRKPRKGGQPVDYSISDEITYWVDRVTQIKAVEEAMLTYEIQKIFEVPHERLGEVLRGTALEATMPPGGAGGGGGGGGGMEDFMGGSDVSSAAADGAASMLEPDE